MTRIFFILLALVPSLAQARDGFVLELFALDEPLEKTMSNVEKAVRLGATHFNVPVLLCQKSKNSNSMYWCNEEQGVSTQTYREHLAKLIKALRAKGLTVGIFPFQLSHDGAWRGFFEPTDFNAWSESYLKHLNEIASWQSEMGFVDFIAGSELGGLYDHEAFWRRALGELKAKMPGVSVFIVANWDRYDRISFWDASDFVGLSAYYPLAEPDVVDTSIASLTKRWRVWAEKILTVSRKQNKQIYFSEVGYSSMKSAASEPWRFEPPAPLDLELQARLYQVFSNVWAADAANSSKLARFMLWALEVVDEPLQDIGFSVIGKPAEKPLSEAFLKRER